jgi:hypothetical protein
MHTDGKMKTSAARTEPKNITSFLRELQNMEIQLLRQSAWRTSSLESVVQLFLLFVVHRVPESNIKAN